jgi:hypothetical protein
LNANLLFQVSQLFTNRGLCNMKPPSGAAEAALFGGGGEIAQVS